MPMHRFKTRLRRAIQKNPSTASIEEHIRQWNGCFACEIGAFAKKRCHLRGVKAARVMFIGEGPGKTEDLIGLPFVGKAGRLLNGAIDEAGLPRNDLCFANLLLCRPTEYPGGPNRPPHEEEMFNCRQRVLDLFAIVQPIIIVTLGRIAEEWTPVEMTSSVKVCEHLPHPSYICRMGGRSSKLHEQFVDSLRNINNKLEALTRGLT